MGENTDDPTTVIDKSPEVNNSIQSHHSEVGDADNNGPGMSEGDLLFFFNSTERP